MPTADQVVDRVSRGKIPLTSKVLVTGVNGLLGRHLAFELVRRGFTVTGTIRDQNSLSGVRLPDSVRLICSGSLGANTDWSAAIDGVSHVFHTAAHVHVRHPSNLDRQLFREVNVEASARLAGQCRDVGVGRLIFVSSAAVYSSELTDYGRSKIDAEQAIEQQLRGSGTGWVVVRPPMIYGPSGRGSFARLDQLVRSRIPLPIASLKSKRSLISVFNLVDFLIHLVNAPGVEGAAWPVADGPAVETVELFRQIARARSINLREWRLSPELIGSTLRWLGRGDDADRLLNSFELNIEETLRSTGWRARWSLGEGVRMCVRSRVAD